MEYKLIRSNRKTIELSIDNELCPVIKAPTGMSQKEVGDFFEKHRRWVEKNIEEKRSIFNKDLKSISFYICYDTRVSFL